MWRPWQSSRVSDEDLKLLWGTGSTQHCEQTFTKPSAAWCGLHSKTFKAVTKRPQPHWLLSSLSLALGFNLVIGWLEHFRCKQEVLTIISSVCHSLNTTFCDINFWVILGDDLFVGNVVEVGLGNYEWNSVWVEILLIFLSYQVQEASPMIVFCRLPGIWVTVQLALVSHSLAVCLRCCYSWQTFLSMCRWTSDTFGCPVSGSAVLHANCLRICFTKQKSKTTTALKDGVIYAENIPPPPPPISCSESQHVELDCVFTQF